jgi:macrolide transport system ATP-binding/permease protein
MKSLRAWWLRLTSAFDGDRPDRELAGEINSHLAMHVDDNIRAGMTPDEARRAALVRFGGVEQTKERYRDRRGVPVLEHLFQDLRYAVRVLRKNPGFASAAILTLGLGIGANAAIFSFADATAFRPPDVPRPGELVRLFTSTKATPYEELSYPDYLDYRSRNTTISGLVAYENAVISLARTRDESPHLLGAWAVSGNFFTVLEVEPTLGRGFRDEDVRVAGASPVVVLGHRLWERLFQSDPAAIGAHVTLSGHDFTIVGVAPAGFGGTELYFHPDLYVPLTMIHELSSGVAADAIDNRSSRWLTVVGRLRPGTRLQRATAEAASIAAQLAQSFPDTSRDRAAIVLPELTARARLDSGGVQGAFIMLGIVGLVLLMACANVANLMLARATGRTREMALRLAVGASRGRLIQQLMTEGLLLATAGGGIGLLLGAWTGSFLGSITMPTDLPIGAEARLDTRLLLFTLAVTSATAVVFGLAPALRSTRIDLAADLKAFGRTTDMRSRRFSLRNALIATQIAGSILLLVTAGLAVRAFMKARDTDPGFRIDHVLLLSFDAGMAHYNETQGRQFYQRVLEQTTALPDVVAAGLVRFIPLGISSATVNLVIDDYQMPAGQDRVAVPGTTVDAGYWGAMRTPILRGRAFDDRDTATSPKVAVINETLARQYWPNQDALGKALRVGDGSGPAVEVVGIAKDGKYGYVREPQQPFIFLPFSQRYRSAMTMTVRTRDNPADIAGSILKAVRAVDPSVPTYDVRTLENLFEARAMLPPRLTSQSMTALGLLGLALSAIGLYGVIAYMTALRTREIGIRMAIGANRLSVVVLVLRQMAAAVLVGLAVGLVLAVVLTPLLAGPFDIEPRDGIVFALVPLIVLVVSLLAAILPAQRAARVDPMIALRSE